ncbi:hypothetical protein C8Q69DRAFT_453277 [Paecilomyces variotii]|uniref:Secreted protein n=1 Tax=Byssochlamys spectabilis TaxID=264951 RepID=A0A443I7F7_BYSSP|nr:hypothetical protein C8Q69DRAFT_453277 [Paecilomyces variotii]RWQ99992.1 hypothetical protein C8Q69DRAFT_453277 [Paecilomyces variotii]
MVWYVLSLFLFLFTDLTCLRLKTSTNYLRSTEYTALRCLIVPVYRHVVSRLHASPGGVVELWPCVLPIHVMPD